MQAVAAIKGVTTGVFLGKIKQYDEEVLAENRMLQEKLRAMTSDYEAISQKVIDTDHSDYLDFHSRRLVEMAGNIIMGYLLIIDSQRDEKYKRSAKLFIDLAGSENHEKYNYIDNFDLESLEMYKLHKSEILEEKV